MVADTEPGVEERLAGEFEEPVRWHGERHPSPKEYVRIALILGVITAAEVTVYYIASIRSLLVPLLLFFAVIKFSLVVLWYMHLKFDTRTYARFFVMGLAGAVTLYLFVLLMFKAFSGGS